LPEVKGGISQEKNNTGKLMTPQAAKVAGFKQEFIQRRAWEEALSCMFNGTD